MTDEPAEVSIHVHSLLSQRTRQGVVGIKIGDAETQMPPEKAREVAGMLFEAAESADSDALFWQTFTQMGMGQQECIALLVSFRKLRDAKRAAVQERNPSRFTVGDHED